MNTQRQQGFSWTSLQRFKLHHRDLISASSSDIIALDVYDSEQGSSIDPLV